MKKRILFLAANPVGTTALKLDEEARAIREELERANQRDQFEFVTRLATRPLDMLRSLRDVKPTIAHFAGHAGADGIYLVRDDGRPAHVTRDTLRETFGAAGNSVQIVVLNGCSTEEVAEALCELVPVSVGTSAAIGDDAARVFSIGFYGALAASESAARAYAQGKAAMHLEETGDHELLHLHHRRDVDPDTLVVANGEVPVAPAPVIPRSPLAWAVPPRPAVVVVPAPAAAAGPGSAAGTDLSLRDRAPEAVVSPPSPLRPCSLDAAIAAYRARKAGSFERWDLRTAGPQPTAGNRPAEIGLDEMYIPLRFAANLDPSERDLGAPIGPEELLRLRRPQVVIGGAGSGKTTWMRWTFRRLIRDSGTVPFFLELRAIAAAWTTPQCAARAIDSYLVEALTESGVSDASAVVAALLDDSSPAQPVLLIDGWDELGGHGERVRERLVEFCRAFRRVVVVASSRPYGETRPASAEAFETLYIQPLSDGDVGLLATHFHHRVHGLDESAGARATDEFMTALAAAPDARSLAGTALLLTMMLLVSREGPLPDRRHKLYTACLRNMLLHRVDMREREGAVIGLDQWRPHDSEERLREVAELAYRIQADGYLESRRAPMVRSWDVAVGLLGSEWTRDRREQFLRWLVASAGVLVDRTDGSVHFAHLSFQEHLAAYYLFITREGDERLAVVRDHMDDRDWWETLRLWAGLTGDHWPDKLGPVLAMLRDDTDGYWLAGMIFADGTGSASDFAAWAAELPARLYHPFSTGDDCALAWRVCKQSDRRAALAARLASARESLRWLEAIWHVHWCRLADLEVAPAPALLALEAPIRSAGGAARSRVVFGWAACWPNRGELTVLRLWPSTRAMLGARLQAALSLGARAPELVVMLPPLLALATRSWLGEDQELAENLIRDFIRDFGRFLARDFGRDFGRDLGRYSIRCFGRDFIRYFVRDFVRDLDWLSAPHFLQSLQWGVVRDFVRDFVPDFVQSFEQNCKGYCVRDFVRDLDLPEIMFEAPWLPGFAILELSSMFGRAAPRAALAYGKVPSSVPLLALFRSACRASFAPDNACLQAEVIRAGDCFDGDPLWPALARHVARISTPEDRALLEDLARHPERRAAPLAWGLQYYVRGDLVFDDDSVITLDELCTRAGIPPLPFLEAMPDELDIPLEEARRDRPRLRRGS